jgi:MATE family multidrug resistance protein
MSMMVADTVIAGRYGTLDLAAVAVGNGLYISVVMLLVGILQAVAPTVAHHFGAGRSEAIGPALQQGFWLALMLAVPGTLVLAFPAALLELAHVPPEVAGKAGDYLAATAVGLPAVLFYRTFYAFNNALGRPRALMVISLIATSTHVPLAWTLTHGSLGLPPLGAVGCGLSTAMVSWLGLSCALVYLLRNPAYRRYRIFSHWQAPQPRALAALLRLGVPMGFSTFIEITSFTLIALFVARLGADAVAGHRVVANLAALVYMLPLAMSIATLVLVGQAAGAHDWARARLAVKVSMAVTAGFATTIGIVLWFVREPVIALSSEDPAVRAVALGLVVYVCLYQLSDAVQTVAAHALRGYKVTLLPMFLHTLCFWGVGIGGGFWLSYHAPWRAGAPSVAGFWEASVVATVLASLMFGALLRSVMRRQQGERGA